MVRLPIIIIRARYNKGRYCHEALWNVTSCFIPSWSDILKQNAENKPPGSIELLKVTTPGNYRSTKSNERAKISTPRKKRMITEWKVLELDAFLSKIKASILKNWISTLVNQKTPPFQQLIQFFDKKCEPWTTLFVDLLNVLTNIFRSKKLPETFWPQNVYRKNFKAKKTFASPRHYNYFWVFPYSCDRENWMWNWMYVEF